MNADFKLASVHGAMYTGGNVCYHPSGRSLFAAVNSYLTGIDMHLGNANQSHAASNSQIQCFDLSADGDLALVMGSRGLGFFYSIPARVCIDTISLPPNCTVSCVKFSPCSRFVAVALESTLQIYAAPARRVVAFHGCPRIENIHSALSLPITHIDWSEDSRHVLVSGQDARMKIYPRVIVNKEQTKGYAKAANNLVGHRGAVLGAFFVGAAASGQVDSCFYDQNDAIATEGSSDDGTRGVVSVSHDNAVLIWERSSMPRKELMNAVAENKYRVRVFKKKAGDDDDNAADEEKEEEEEEEEPSDADDETAMPETFLEREKRDAAAGEGVRMSTAGDAHLPPCLRFAYTIKKRHLLQHKGSVTVADYHRARGLLVVGYDTGIFAVHTAAATDCALVHLLSITAQALTACRFSPNGDHIAFGSAHLKQLLVWDWRGETYVLKEQSHYYDISTTAMTADGQCIISGGDDGKLKVWRTTTGQCFVTFTEHQAGITGIATSNSTNAFFSCSKDGTVRGYDLARYRNFRIFHPAERTQLSCIAVDPSGEVLAVGSSRHPRITLFSVQTGRVIDELQGHEGPVTCLAFHPNGTTLASGALDKTMIMWDVFGGGSGGVEAGEGDRLKGEGETLQQTSEVLSVAYSHNGRRMATLTMGGEITVYDTILPSEPQVITTFSTRNDASGGWSSANVGPNSANSNMRFTSITFSPDGDKVVAGGESKWIVLYHATQGFVIRKWPVTNNLDVEGAEEQFKWRVQSEAGNLNSIDIEDDDAHLRKRKLIEMPGSRARHFATGKRKTELVARTMHVAFAGHGRDFVAATTDGLLVFSLDVHRPKFVPLQLQAGLTAAVVEDLLEKEHYVQALIGALLLQHVRLGIESIRRCPAKAIPVAVGAIPSVAFATLLQWVSREVEHSPMIEHSLLWAQAILLTSNEPLLGLSGGTYVNNQFRLEMAADHNKANNVTPMGGDPATQIAPALRVLHRALQKHQRLKSLVHDNFFALKFLQAQVR